jgi:hypothetical protein
MYRFHANVLREPGLFKHGASLTLRGVKLSPLESPAGGPPQFDRTFAVTWEEAQSALLALPRMDCEPDGYFVVAGEAAGERWQIDGHLFEYENQLHRMELHGSCPAEFLDALLTALGWPTQTIVLQLVQEGVTMSEREFRAWAAAG